MKNLFLATIFVVIFCVNFSTAQLGNSTNTTNASIPTNSSSNATTVQLTRLYIGAFFDLGTKSGYGSLPMAQQAIDEINNNTEILPGYQLELVVNSTQGSFGFGQKVLQEFLAQEPKKIMLLGPGTDSLAKSVAAYAGIPEVGLLQFSYGTTDVDLAIRRDLYPNFFRTSTSIASLDAPRIEFIKEYGWDEVGIIYGDSVQYLKLSNQLTDRLKKNNIKVLAEVRLQANDPKRAIRTIKDKGIHVILGMFDRNAVARKMICEAYQQKMYGPHYVWMLVNSYNNNWWIPGKNEELACSDLEMKCQIQNHFSFYHTFVIHPRSRYYNQAKKNGSQIINDYRAKVDNGSDTSNRSSNALDVYDALWSIAFVLHNSRDELLRQGKSLENLTYGDVNATAVFRRHAQNLDFPTPSIGARVRYYQNGDRKNGIVLRQIVIQDGNFKTVQAGSFNVETNEFTASPEIHWFAGTPYTKTTENYIYRTIDRTLFFVLIGFASFGIAYALLCLLVLVLNFKKKLVLNSGPVISMLIILGCILNYVTVILYGFDYSLVSPDTVTRFCRARSWTFAIGFTLSVGGVTAKLWMAYSVLKDRFVRSRNVMMFWMLGILVLLLIVDIIILACWEGTDPLFRTLKQVRSQPEYKCFEPITADTFRAEIEVVEHCDSADLTLWLVIILVFKVLTLLTGGFLAWQTRRVYIPAINDTQHCVSCMFVVVLFCLCGSIVAFATTMYPSAYYGVIGVLIIVATTMILVLLFVNKIFRLSCRRRKRTKTLRIGEESADNTKYASTRGAACARFCPCFACSSACCISCCLCFPFWNLYSCLRAFCCGSQVRSSGGGGGQTKAEFYIGGIAQDRDAEIVNLRNELREKNSQLSNLGHNRTVKTNGTQTEDDEDYPWDPDDGDSMFSDGNVSDLESSQGFDKNKRFRRAANKVRIFSEAVDYSHIKSKVDTGMRRSTLGPTSQSVRRGSRLSVVSSPEDLTKLKTTLAQREEEIQRLRKELEGLKMPGRAVKTQQSPTSEENLVKKSPNLQGIILIETPPTPVPPENPDNSRETINQPKTPNPSGTSKTTSGKITAAVTTQDRSKKKSSLGPAGSWLVKDELELTNDDTSPEKETLRKDSETRHHDMRPKESIPKKDGKDSSKARTSNENQEIKTSRKISKTGDDDKDLHKNVLRKGSNGIRNISLKDNEKTTKDIKPATGSNRSSPSQDKTDTVGEGRIAATLKTSPGTSRKVSLTHVALSVNQGNDKAEEGNKTKDFKDIREKQVNNGQKNQEDENKEFEKGKENKEQNSEYSKDDNGEEPKDEKKTRHRKVSRWLFEDASEEGQDKADDKEKQNEKTGNRAENTGTKINGEGGKNPGENGKTKADEKIRSDSMLKDTSRGGSKSNENTDSLPAVGVNKDEIVDNANNINNKGLRQNNAKKELKRQEDDLNEEGKDRHIGVNEEDDEGDDEFGDDDEFDEDDDNTDDVVNNNNNNNNTTRTNGRGGSKKRRRRRKKNGFGKLKWNAQSKIDTGSGSYKPKTSVKKIPHFKNDYTHVKSRISTVSEANAGENSVEKRQRSISFNKPPDYSKVRPKLYNGTTRRYNSEMPTTVL